MRRGPDRLVLTGGLIGGLGKLRWDLSRRQVWGYYTIQWNPSSSPPPHPSCPVTNCHRRLLRVWLANAPMQEMSFRCSVFMFSDKYYTPILVQSGWTFLFTTKSLCKGDCLHQCRVNALMPSTTDLCILFLATSWLEIVYRLCLLSGHAQHTR